MVLAVPVVVVVLGSWSYRWVQEDAFINFRIIGNLLAGHGPVFNVGERVEAYTDPLWVFVLAVLHTVLPMVSLEWMSVLVGIAMTALGVVLAGRAVQRLAVDREPGVVIPLGLLVFGSVAAVWEFATGGLEMGMVFGWIGLSVWLLVRTEGRRVSAVWCAFVMGLGTLIRPELVLMSFVFLVGLGIVVAAPGWKGPGSIVRRYLVPAVAAAALPVLYELFRASYFALVVSNTALAKSAGSAWWSQGCLLPVEFREPLSAVRPLGHGGPPLVPRMASWWQRGDRMGTTVLVTPAVAGLADTLYVTRLGGDYMHGRLLLPAFFALCLASGSRRPTPLDRRDARPRHRRVVGGVPRVVALHHRGPLHRGARHRQRAQLLGGRSRQSSPDHRERLAPVRVAGDRLSPRRQRSPTLGAEVDVRGHRTDRARTRPPAFARPGRHFRSGSSSTPPTSGSTATSVGPDVYIFDTFSLANPIGSHTSLAVRGRPGHEKDIGPEWMVARFGVPGGALPAGISQASVEAARRALTCTPLAPTCTPSPPR